MEGEKKPRPVSPATQLRRRKAVQGLLAGKQVKDALVEAGYSRSTATRNPGEILKGLQSEFATALDGMLPKAGMVAALVEGLGATKTAHVYNPQLGIVEHFTEPDYYSRVKCAELLAKLGGLISRTDKLQVEHTTDIPERLARAWRRVEGADVTASVIADAEMVRPVLPERAQPVEDDNSAKA